MFLKIRSFLHLHNHQHVNGNFIFQFATSAWSEPVDKFHNTQPFRDNK